MEMGGYNMPDYMAYGGVPRYDDGGDPPPTDPPSKVIPKTDDGVAVDANGRPINNKKVSKKQYEDSAWETRTDSQGQYKYNKVTGAIEGRKEYSSDRAPSGGVNPNLISDLCRNMKQKGSVHYGKTAAEVITFAGYKPGTALYDKHLVTLKACEQKGEIESEEAIYTEEEPVKTPCPCVDDKGVAMKNADGTPMLAKKDASGNCLPCTEPIETCECEKEDGTKFDPGKNTDGTCKDCDTPGIKPKPTPTPAKWWLQDTVNTMGAFGDLARVKKQMPWEARVDLEEPRPVFLDPTRELAAQSEQANIASQASGQFAGAQAQGARLSAIQGQGAESAANTLSRINNANVGIANQFEGQQVGIRNQEQMANQQMANRVYDKNVIANQQFDNAKTAGRSNLRQSYNTGVTNKWKTDALNQMYPNYQTDPSVGGRVAYTPTDKTLDKTAEDESFESFINSIRDESPEIQKAMIAHKYPKARGGQSFEYGGFVYNVFPD